MTTPSRNSSIPGTADPVALPGPTVVPRRVALVALALTVAAVQFSIAIAEIFLAVALAAWAVTLVFERRRPSAPPWMLPLMLYGGWTLVSAVLSPERAISLIDCKQLVLLLLVPLTYEIVEEGSAIMLTTIIITAGAISAVIGIGQYSILHYDNLGQRPRSTLGLYMTFAGLVMLVLNVALGRVLFMTRSRLWPALLIPALAVVLPLSLSRNAWVGACCGAALLLMLRDFRLTAALPVAGASPRAVLLHLQPAGPDNQRSVCDDARRQADHPRPSRLRRRTEHDRTGVPAVSRAHRRPEDDTASS
jgi:hypothetical protein